MVVVRHPLSDLESRLISVAAEHGFTPASEPVKYFCELEHPDGVTVYLNRPRTLVNVIAVLIHPETDLSRLAGVMGLAVPSGIWHGRNMRRFPKRVHTGKHSISYAHSVECADLGAFGRLLDNLV
ncbi:hypothetical protein [Microtetraspora sp. NBRC 16547]|uniref:hypothetical protein n=1 Tax=Microtetraspora sp. NBRC 16547 TaxID=3030993 RepID=UPI0024A53E7D|nr:hypothetical protein [Microtetraspora sp. NBRC 16547]GLW98905.1 hypothetical protein Misp02_29920 [Microtetraspora sp. NBRC 16547]